MRTTEIRPWVRVSVSVTVTPVTGSVRIGYRASVYPVVALK